MTARPYFGSGSSIECPPTIAAPAAATTSWPPRRISRSTLGAERARAARRRAFSAVTRLAAHRVDVGQRVRRGDPAEVVRVVDDRGEEVDGLHDREVVAHPDDGGVVGRRDADEHARVGRRGQLAPRARASAAAGSLQPQPAPWDREVSGRRPPRVWCRTTCPSARTPPTRSTPPSRALTEPGPVRHAAGGRAPTPRRRSSACSTRRSHAGGLFGEAHDGRDPAGRGRARRPRSARGASRRWSPRRRGSGCSSASRSASSSRSETATERDARWRSASWATPASSCPTATRAC